MLCRWKECDCRLAGIRIAAIDREPLSQMIQKKAPSLRGHLSLHTANKQKGTLCVPVHVPVPVPVCLREVAVMYLLFVVEKGVFCSFTNGIN